MAQVNTQNAGLTLSAPRPLSIATNSFCHSACLGSGDDIWVGSTGWDGVTQAPPYPGTPLSKIERFNRKTGAQIAAITVGPYYANGTYEHGILGICCAHGLVVAADIQAGEAVIVDPSNNTITKRTTVGNLPRHAEPDADGFWISVSGDRQIVKLDSSGDIISASRITFPSGAQPYRMRYVDGVLYVADFGLGKVYAVDPVNYTYTTITVGTAPWACDKRGNLLIAANLTSNTVTVKDLTGALSTVTINFTAGDGLHDVKFLSDDVFEAVCSGSNKIKIFSTAGNPLHTINVQNDPAGLTDRDSDGYIYNTNAASNVLTATRIEA